MGIILMPIILLVIVLVIVNSYQLNKFHELELLNIKVFLFGFFISVFSYGMIVLSYFLAGKMYGLSPYFRIPIFMFFIPSFIGFIGMNSNNQTLRLTSHSFMASTMISGILILIFSYYVIHLIELLGVESYY